MKALESALTQLPPTIEQTDSTLAKVGTFAAATFRDGAFVGRTAAENYYVVCDQRLNTADDVARGRFQLLFGFATLRPGEFQSYLVTQQPDGSSARAASVNRYALPRQS